MELPQPYIVRYTAYSPQEAVNLLLRINIEDTITLPPVKPKAGDVFIYANKDAKGLKMIGSPISIDGQIMVSSRALALEAIKKDSLDEAFKLLRDNLDPPDDVYEAIRRYYAMEWSSGEFVDDFWVRLVREAKRAKHSSRQACTNLITQLPAEIQSACKSWIADKGEELSGQEAREFIVKVRSLLVERGIPADRGWRKTDVLQITSATKTGKQASAGSVDSSDEEDCEKVQVVRGMSRGWRKGRYWATSGTGRKRAECFACGKAGHFERQCPERKCHNCGGAGHYADECWRGRETSRWQRGQNKLNKNRILKVEGFLGEGSVTIQIKVAGQELFAMLDTGAMPSVIDKGTVGHLGLINKASGSRGKQGIWPL